MSDKKPKTTTGVKPAPAVIIPPASTPIVPAVESSTVDVPHVVVLVDTPKHALQRIAEGRLCGCKGDHDPEVYDCPKSIARAALEAK